MFERIAIILPKDLKKAIERKRKKRKINCSLVLKV